MADCTINPSFLRSFDFKLLYASSGAEEFRTMDYNPMTGEVVCLPFGNNHLLQSKDWGYTFERKEGALDILQTQNVVLDARFGLGRYGMFATNTKLNGGIATSISGSRQGTALVVMESDTLVAEEGFFNSLISSGVAGGVSYANGCFVFSVATANSVGGAPMLTRWYSGSFTKYGLGTTSVGLNRFGVARGNLVYAPGLIASSNLAGKSPGIYSQSFPISGLNIPAAVLRGNFTDPTSVVEVSDFQNYSRIVADGAVFIERIGRIWRATEAEMSTWAIGGDIPVRLVDRAFPHIAAGYGRFNDSVLLTLDPSGTVGLFSTDHGVTLQSFDLPQELGQTLPGGIFTVSGGIDLSFPRCYTIKYIPDPETNFTKGRWILCGGLAVWELIPVYGA